MDKSFQKLEYETQLYGFSSDEIVQEVTGIMSSAVDEALEALNGFFSKNSMENGIEEPGLMLKEEYKRALQNLIPKLKEPVYSCFAIPESHLLPEDSIQKIQYSKDELNQVVNKTVELKERVGEVSHMENMLQNELQCQEIIEPTTAQVKQCQIAVRKGLLESVPYIKRAISYAETTTATCSATKGECGGRDLFLAKLKEESS